MIKFYINIYIFLIHVNEVKNLLLYNNRGSNNKLSCENYYVTVKYSGQWSLSNPWPAKKGKK